MAPGPTSDDDEGPTPIPALAARFGVSNDEVRAVERALVVRLRELLGDLS